MAFKVNDPSERSSRPGFKIVDDEPGIGSALVGGLLRHPLVGPALDTVSERLGVPRARLDALERGLGADSSLERLVGFVGEFGPDFAAGLGAYGLGRAAGVGLLRSASVGATAGQRGAVAARAARDAAQAAQRAGLGRATSLEQLRMPAIERAALVAGGNFGVGAYEGVRTLAGGGSPRDALRQAAIVTAIGSVAETGLIGLTHRLGRARAGRLDQAAIRSRVAPKPVEKHLKKLEKKRVKQEGRLIALGDQLDEALDVSGHATSLEHAVVLARAQETLPGKVAKAEQKLASTETSIVAAHRGFLGRTGAEIQYVTDEPFVPSGFRESLHNIGRKIGITPEGLMGRHGASAGRVYEAMMNMDAKVIWATSRYRADVAESMHTAFRAIGVNPNSAKVRNSDAILRIQHEMERLGGGRESAIAFLQNPTPEVKKVIGKVSRDKATAFVDELDAMWRADRQMASRVADHGGFPLLSDEQLAKEFQVGRHFSHISEPGMADDEVARQVSAMVGEADAVDVIRGARSHGFMPSQRINRQRGPGSETMTRIGHFGTHDFTRTLPGTAWEKFHRGLPIARNPWDATLRQLQAGERRIQATEIFGARGELIDTFADAVEEEVTKAAARVQGPVRKIGDVRPRTPGAEGKATAATFQNVVENYLDHRYVNEGLNRFSRTVTSLNTASKLGLGVIPNLTQIQNDIFMFGLRNTLRGVGRTFRAEERRWLEAVVAIPHTQMRAQSGALEAGALSQRSERFAEWVLRYTGFEPVEKMQRLFAGSTGRAVWRDTVIRAGEGRLRGTQLDSAFRMMADLGVDLGEEVKRYRTFGRAAYFSPADNTSQVRLAALEERVAFRAAQKTQFIPSKLRRPTMWNHPLGRVAFQFKTFALGQARLIKDSVLAEAALGNMKPLAYWVSMTPIAGAFVLSAKDLFRQSPKEMSRDPIFQTAELFMAAGGFGIAGDMWTSALHGDLLGGIAGPTVANARDIVEALVQQNPDEIIQLGTRLPTARAASTMFGAAAGVTDAAIDAYLEATNRGAKHVTIGRSSLVQSDILNKAAR